MVILIIGASGFLGSLLFCKLGKNNNVIGTYFSREKTNLIRLDVRDKNQVSKTIKRIMPDIIVDCGGMTRPDTCELEPDLAYSTNVDGVNNLIEFSNCKIIYFSTDYVFDGTRGFYSENDGPNPINIYGQTKLEAENKILGKKENLVIRVSGLYGINSLNNEFMLSLLSNSIIYRANDCYSSNLLINDIVENWQFLISQSGIYHLSDSRRISRFEFASKAVTILGLQTKVVAKPMSELHQIALRPKECSLISIKHNLIIRNENEGLRYLLDKE